MDSTTLNTRVTPIPCMKNLAQLKTGGELWMQMKLGQVVLQILLSEDFTALPTVTAEFRTLKRGNVVEELQQNVTTMMLVGVLIMLVFLLAIQATHLREFTGAHAMNCTALNDSDAAKLKLLLTQLTSLGLRGLRVPPLTAVILDARRWIEAFRRAKQNALQMTTATSSISALRELIAHLASIAAA